MWGYIIWGIILIIIIAGLVRLRSLYSIYVCPKCGSEFTLTSRQEFFFPQIMYRKISRCPNCQKVVYAKIIKNQDNLDKLENTKKDKVNPKNQNKNRKNRKK